MIYVYYPAWGDVMLDNELKRFQQEMGKVKQDLLSCAPRNRLGDEEGYRLATKIDLTISKMIQILEHK